MAKNKRESRKKNEQGAVTPYLLGWILGVPGSVLLAIFVLRSCA